jgi:hypothetical protein
MGCDLIFSLPAPPSALCTLHSALCTLHSDPDPLPHVISPVDVHLFFPPAHPWNEVFPVVDSHGAAVVAEQLARVPEHEQVGRRTDHGVRRRLGHQETGNAIGWTQTGGHGSDPDSIASFARFAKHKLKIKTKISRLLTFGDESSQINLSVKPADDC